MDYGLLYMDNTCYEYSSGFLKKIVMLLKKEARERYTLLLSVRFV